MKIYTKTGDSGETGLFHGPRAAKDDPRIEALGTVDELCSVMGLARASQVPVPIGRLLEAIQQQLFALGAELATPDAALHGTQLTAEAHIQELEAAIDDYQGRLPPLTAFILPGGAPAAAALHLARAVCRRAERRVVSLGRDVCLSPYLVPYLNRLGDLLFVLARATNAAANKEDTPWHKRGGESREGQQGHPLYDNPGGK
jgi:cob(I)alamin adenosyltransferase